MSDKPSLWDRLRGFLGGKPAEATPQKEPPAQPSAKPEPATPAAQTPVRPTNPAQAASPQPPPRIAVVPKPTVDLVLGVDFGTSCTKVVIGDPGWRNESFAVPFSSPNGNIAAWLHPTRLENEYNLKMRLMDQPQSSDTRALAACYLAGILQHSRAWFAAHCPSDYRQREFQWALNVGFPDKSVSGSPLAAAYKQVAETAVALAVSAETPTRERAHRFIGAGATTDSFIPARRIGLYPEIAAQLAGYISSPYWKKGNLLLIDVGAGTLDVSTMILWDRAQQEVVSFHFCEVASLGVLRLYQRRIAALEEVAPGCVKQPLEYYQDGARTVPDGLHEYVDRPSKQLQEAFDRASLAFAGEVIGVAMKCLARFRKAQRDAHENPGFEPWGRHLRFFLTGGGSRSSFYKNFVTEGPLEDRLASVFTCWHPERPARRSADEGLRREALPLPHNFNGFPNSLSAHFDRVSVAHGLAIGAQDLMRITTRPEG